MWEPLGLLSGGRCSSSCRDQRGLLLLGSAFSCCTAPAACPRHKPRAELTEKAGVLQDFSRGEVCADAILAQKLISVSAGQIPCPLSLTATPPGWGQPLEPSGKDGLGRPPASQQCIASLSHGHSAACMAHLPYLCGRAEVKFPHTMPGIILECYY